MNKREAGIMALDCVASLSGSWMDSPADALAEEYGDRDDYEEILVKVSREMDAIGRQLERRAAKLRERDMRQLCRAKRGKPTCQGVLVNI